MRPDDRQEQETQIPERDLGRSVKGDFLSPDLNDQRLAVTQDRGVPREN